MAAVLVYIWEVIVAGWGMLVEAAPWLSKAGPWLAGLLPALIAWLRQATAWMFADTVESVMKGSVAIAIRIAVVTAWGILLAVVFTGLTGLGLREVFFVNPFSGFPAAMMFLVAAAFPLKFGFGLATSYIIWRFTVMQATLVMMRTVKFLFGA
jgi:hypothetical protein